MAHEEYLSVEEAAKRLRVGVETVRRYIRAGSFDVAKVGRQYLIRPESVTAFLEKQFADRQSNIEKLKATADDVEKDKERWEEMARTSKVPIHQASALEIAKHRETSAQATRRTIGQEEGRLDQDKKKG